MKFTKKLLAETLNKVSNGGKTFTSGKKQNVIISEEQLERVLSVVEEQWQEIKEISVVRSDASEKVYNFTVDGIHSYIANGIVVHNK